MTKWLQISTSKKTPKGSAYDYIGTVHGNISTDGNRMHHDPSLPKCECGKCDQIHNLLEQARSADGCIFTITRAALETTCKQALAIGKGDTPRNSFIPSLYLTVNGALQYEAASEGHGRVWGEWHTMQWETSRHTTFPVVKKVNMYGTTYRTVQVTYSHHGKDMRFAVNPKFLLEALSGMDGETVTLRTNARNSSIHMTDGQREAVVMPIST